MASCATAWSIAAPTGRPVTSATSASIRPASAPLRQSGLRRDRGCRPGGARQGAEAAKAGKKPATRTGARDQRRHHAGGCRPGESRWRRGGERDHQALRQADRADARFGRQFLQSVAHLHRRRHFAHRADVLGLDPSEHLSALALPLSTAPPGNPLRATRRPRRRHRLRGDGLPGNDARARRVAGHADRSRVMGLAVDFRAVTKRFGLVEVLHGVSFRWSRARSSGCSARTAPENRRW